MNLHPFPLPGQPPLHHNHARYDALYRLKTALTNGSTGYPQWGLSWTYDRYGNRTAQSISAGCVSPMTCPTNSVSIDATTNRITGTPYSYDANGNMTNDGLNTMAYDAENRLVTSGGSTYNYDGNSLRVKKVSGGSTTVYLFSGTKVIAEYVNGAAPNAPAKEYIYSGGVLLATIAGTTTSYHHGDHVSVRLTTDTTGNVASQQGHYPFGESWYSASTTTKWQFAGYERDAESGNDYSVLRFAINRLGRFSSADRLAGSVRNPQSLNRYVYVRNDPANGFDPLGLTEEECVDDPSCGGGGGGGPDEPPGVGSSLLDFLSGLADGPPPPPGGEVVVVNDTATNVDPFDASIGGLGDGGGGGGGGNSSAPESPVKLSPKGRACQDKVQSAVNAALHGSSQFQGPELEHNLDGSEPGLINGAYNFNYFVPGVNIQAPAVLPNCGRFDSGLHIIVPGVCNPSRDPITPNWGFNAQQNGSYFTAHIDSANPNKDLASFFIHLFRDVLLRSPHGC